MTDDPRVHVQSLKGGVYTLADVEQIRTADAMMVQFLREALAQSEQECARFRDTLTSIANNSCCTPCREAALVARAALEA